MCAFLGVGAVKHVRTSLAAGALLAIGSSILLAQPATKPAERPPEALKLSLSLEKQQLRATFQNQAKQPIVLNLGMMIGNGRQLFPSHLALQVIEADRKTIYTKLGGPIGGRVDDWLVPLAPGDSYTLTIAVADLREEKTLAPLRLPATCRLVMHFEGIEPANKE